MEFKEFKQYVINYLVEKNDFIFEKNLLYKEFNDFFFVINIVYSKFDYYTIIYNYSLKNLHKEKALIDFDVQISRDLQTPVNVFNKEYLSGISEKDLKKKLDKTFNIVLLLEKKGINYIYKHDKGIIFKKSREYLESIIKI